MTPGTKFKFKSLSYFFVLSLLFALTFSYHNYDTDNIRYLETALGFKENPKYYDSLYRFYGVVLDGFTLDNPFSILTVMQLINFLIFVMALLVTLNHLRINNSIILFVFFCIMFIETRYAESSLVNLSNFGLQYLVQFKALFYFLTVFSSINIMYLVYQHKRISTYKLFLISIWITLGFISTIRAPIYLIILLLSIFFFIFMRKIVLFISIDILIIFMTFIYIIFIDDLTKFLIFLVVGLCLSIFSPQFQMSFDNQPQLLRFAQLLFVVGFCIQVTLKIIFFIFTNESTNFVRFNVFYLIHEDAFYVIDNLSFTNIFLIFIILILFYLIFNYLHLHFPYLFSIRIIMFYLITLSIILRQFEDGRIFNFVSIYSSNFDKSAISSFKLSQTEYSNSIYILTLQDQIQVNLSGQRLDHGYTLNEFDNLKARYVEDRTISQFTSKEVAILAVNEIIDLNEHYFELNKLSQMNYFFCGPNSKLHKWSNLQYKVVIKSKSHTCFQL